MGVKRVVDTDFWKDDCVAEKYSAEDRYFFLYLLTNPNSKQCGIYHLPLRVIAFEMGHSRDSVESIIDRFEHRFKNIIYNKETQEIAILNFLKYSIVKGGKPVEDCIRKELEKVKDKTLIRAVYENMKSYMDENIAKNDKSIYINIKKIFKTFINNININDNDNERIVPRIVNESSKKAPYVEIADYLNEKIGARYSAKSSKTQTLINARMNEGFTLEDFKTVIDKKCNDWLKDTKMSKYLRPETLFGTKFEGYLNEIQKKKTLPSWYQEPTKQQPKYVEPTGESLKDLEDFFKNKE